MSATFRLSAKSKVSQDELRKLMAEQKRKVMKQPKIDNPLAKYNEAGQLMCVLCKSLVRSENVWNVHVNAKQHRENVAEAKRLKELTNNFTTAVKVKGQKRSGSPPPNAPEEKKIKGILKNAPVIPMVIQKPPKNNAPVIVSFHNEEIKRAPILPLEKLIKEEKASTSKMDDDPSIEQPAPDQPIPEGFFDDPILDAKVRNIEYKDPVEEEWEKFQKEIKEEASASAEIIAGEQEEATAERQIEEIDEQMRNWSRVLDIEQKKDEIKKKQQEMDQMSEDEDNDDSDNEADIDEFLDWRAKKAYR